MKSSSKSLPESSPEETKQFKTSYAPTSDHFGILSKTGTASWFGCREQFHRAIMKRQKRDFIYSYSKEYHDRIKNFIGEFERRLGLPKTRIIPTNSPYCLYVETGEFWEQQPIRHSLFTALIRAATKYDGSNFDSALYSRYYLSDTKEAVERFLDGYTWYVGNSGQWHSTFSRRKTPDFAERILIKAEMVPSDESRKEAENIILAAGLDRGSLIFLLAQSFDKLKKAA